MIRMIASGQSSSAVDRVLAFERCEIRMVSAMDRLSFFFFNLRVFIKE